MKRLLSLIAMTAVTTLPIIAGPLTPEQAVARSMSSIKKAPGMASVELENAPAYSSVTAMGTPVAYVFNNKDADGYFILAADDVAYPMLGYIVEGSFSEENMAPALKWWLEEYGRQIEFANSKNAGVAQKSPVGSHNSDWEAVPQMVTTKWNQDSPYNLQCPKLNGELCVTGCVATSMAQVMNYFKYPDVGEGSITYYPSTLNKKMVLDFSKKEFKWDDMLDYYVEGNYTDEQASAVAYLMKACGFATKMQYSPEMSGTQGELIAAGLRTYFKYDGNVHSQARLPYSWTEWSTMIYENLKNVGPLVINGSSMYGGHSFVCDGYDGNGYFHFNWGWGGVSDGYFALDALNPDAQGIGGYAGGYNFNQDAIVGIQKPTGQPVEVRPARLTQYGASVGEIDGDDLLFGIVDSSIAGWGNNTDQDILVKIGAKFESEDGDFSNVFEGAFGTMTRISLSPGSYMPADRIQPVFTLPELSDGRYKVTLCSYDLLAEEAEWLPVVVEWSMPNFVYLIVSEGSYTVENAIIPALEFDNVDVISELYINCNFKIRTQVSNPYDIEMAQPVSPVLMSNGKVVYTGQSMLVVLNPGETKEVEWVSRFDSKWGEKYPSATEFDLGLINPQTNKLYMNSGKVTMYPNPGTLKVSMAAIGLADTPSEAMTIDDCYFGKVFTTKNLDDFTFDLAFKVTAGYFDGQLTIGLYEVTVTGEYRYDVVPLGDPVFQDYPFVALDDTYEHHQQMGIENGKDDQLYAVKVEYTSGMRINTLGIVFFMNNTGNGVESVIGNDSAVEYYNLQGLKVTDPHKGQILIEKKAGKTRKVTI